MLPNYNPESHPPALRLAKGTLPNPSLIVLYCTCTTAYVHPNAYSHFHHSAPCIIPLYASSAGSHTTHACVRAHLYCGDFAPPCPLRRSSLSPKPRLPIPDVKNESETSPVSFPYPPAELPGPYPPLENPCAPPVADVLP